jgi:hypothetical protein
LWVTLSYVEEEAHSRRRLLFEATGERYQDLLFEFRRRAFGAMPD